MLYENERYFGGITRLSKLLLLLLLLQVFTYRSFFSFGKYDTVCECVSIVKERKRNMRSSQLAF